MNVVLDLMIHDIDLVQSLASSQIVSIDAIGTPVFSGEIDIANARIRFANGCVANVTASRVSMMLSTTGNTRGSPLAIAARRRAPLLIAVAPPAADAAPPRP